MTSKWSILIVDDEFGVRESLKMILKSSYDIHTASDGEEALKIIRGRKIHLITLDLNMPKLSGIDTLREIRKNKRRGSCNYNSRVWDAKGSKRGPFYGVREFISKPFSISKITSVIDGILEKQIESKERNTKKRPVKCENF